MSTDSRFTTFQRRGGGLALSIVVLALLWIPLHRTDPSLGYGLLVGGGIVVTAGAFALWRTHRNGDTSAVERQVGGVGDERDSLVMTHTWAVVGKAAIMWTTLALILTVLDLVDAAVALTCALWAQILTLVIAYLVNARRL